MELEGIIKKGHGRAANYFTKQKVLFERRGLKGVSGFKDGTINVSIHPLNFNILNYDYYFKNIAWDEGRLEDFGFVAIDKIYYNDIGWTKPGYIYIPFNSPHFSNKSQFEVLSVNIPLIIHGKSIILLVDDDKIELKSSSLY